MAIAEPATKRYTIDDIADFPDDGRLRELVDGRIVEWGVTNIRHGLLTNRIARVLDRYVAQQDLGEVVTNDSLVRIQSSQYDARGGDIMFYQSGRLPEDLDAAATLVAPDMVIEILSPSDRVTLVELKVQDWLRAGVRLLWYVNPETGRTTVYHGGHITSVAAEETLDGADVVPGFTLRMTDLLVTRKGTKAANAQP